MSTVSERSHSVGCGFYYSVLRFSLFAMASMMLMFGTVGCGSGTGGGCGRRIHSSVVVHGQEAPDFTLPALKNGEDVTLSALSEDGPVLLVFWASWCPSCVEEIPTLNQWYQKFSGKGLRILAVNVEEEPGHVKEFVEKQSMYYPIVLDREGEVTAKYGLMGLPAAVFINSERKIVYFSFSLPQNIEQLLKDSRLVSLAGPSAG